MKKITLTEAKTHLSYYGRLCLEEPVVVTVKGIPAFQLIPAGDRDDLVDQLIEHSQGFRNVLEARAGGETVTIDEAIHLLDADSASKERP